MVSGEMELSPCVPLTTKKCLTCVTFHLKDRPNAMLENPTWHPLCAMANVS